MINSVLTYLHEFYGDGKFHDLTPLIRKNPSAFTEGFIYNLHLDGFIEIQEPSAFDSSNDRDEIHPVYGRLTDKGMYYLDGDRKIATVIKAIEDQLIIDIAYTDEDGHEERVALSPYVYGKDTEERACVWGIVSGDDNTHRRFLLDNVVVTEEPVGSFRVDKEMILSQPRDIEVVAQVQY
ncbi:hypothetical protein GCM10027443_15310 [Pontibacter brevis]